jgi:ribosomal protein L40E
MDRVKWVIRFFTVIAILSLIAGIIQYSQLREAVSTVERSRLNAMGLRSPFDLQADIGLIASIALSIGLLLFNMVIGAIGRILDNTDEIIIEIRRQKLPSHSTAVISQASSPLLQQTPSISYSQSERWTCLNCGQTNPKIATFCKGCGEYK